MALSIGELVGYVDLDIGPAQNAAGQMNGVLQSASSGWSKTMKVAGVAAGAIFAAGLAGAINLEPGRDRVAAALGLSAEDAERVGKLSGQLYSDGWGESAEDVNLALEAVMSSIKGMRNASDSELRGATEAAVTFGDAFGIDVTKAVSTAGNMINTGLAKNATQAFDLLTKASQKVPAAVREDVLDATDEYGQFFATLGIKGPEAMGMLAAGAEKGMYGIDKAGDAVKEFTIRATDMSTSSQEAYDAIGLDADRMANNVLAGGKKARRATDQIIDGLLSIENPADRANQAIKLFGTPLEDLNASDIPAFLSSLRSGGSQLGKFAGSTAKMGDTLYDNAATNLSIVGRELKSAIVETIGGKVLPVVTELTGVLAEKLGPALATVGGAAASTARWLREHSTVAAVLTGVIGGLVAITAAHGVTMAVSAAGGMAAWLKGTRLVSAATKVWAAVQWALNAAMTANPIGLVVVAVAALVAAFVIAYKRSDKFRAIVNAAFKAVRKVVGSVVGWFTKTVPNAVEKVAKLWDKGWNAIKSATTRIAGAVIRFVKSIPGKIVGFFLNWTLPGLIVKHWDKIKSGTIRVATSTVDWVKGLPGRFVRGLSSLGSSVGSVFSSAMSGAKDRVTNIGGTIVDWITAIPGRLLGLAGKFGDAGKALLQQFVDGMKNAAGVISGIAGNVWTAVKGLLNGAIDRINSALEFKISLPGPDLSVNLPNIPHLATGGRVTGDTVARIGEGREPESVLPDSMLRGLLERAHNAGRDSAAGARETTPGGRGVPLIGQVVQAAGESTENLAERLWFKTRTRG